MACDKDEAKGADVVARLVDDREAQARLRGRLAELEGRLRELEQELRDLSGTLEDLNNSRDGRSGRRAPRGLRHPLPHMPTPPHFSPVPPVPAIPAMPAMEFHGAPPGMPEEAREAYLEAQEEWQEQLAELREDWQERQEQWRQRWHDQYAERMDDWRRQMDEWRDRQHEQADEWRERLREMGENGAAWAEHLHIDVPDIDIEIPDIDIPDIDIQVPEIEIEGLGIRTPGPDGRSLRFSSDDDGARRHRVVYDVSGDQADALFELLAPSDVRVIVSRAGEHVGVAGTDREHAVLTSGLQLLGWIDRDVVFERMTQGDREARRYELGSARARTLYEMLAPDTVKVVVSRAGDDAVSIRATDREHQVLSDLLTLLNWQGGGVEPGYSPGPAGAEAKARIMEEIKAAKEEQKRAEKSAKQARKQAEKRAQQERKQAEKQQARAEKRANRELEEAQVRSQPPSTEGRSTDSTTWTFELAGAHADRLYELLAPNYVKIIVWRSGNELTVRGTERQLAE